MPSQPRAPQQARSRASLERLLRAATEILDAHGLDGATIPRIAARARLSPGAVYRRFRDKDALLRTLFLQALRTSNTHTEALLTREFLRRPLSDIAREVVALTLQSHRQHAGFLRAMNQFCRSHPSARYRRQADALELQNFQLIVDAILEKRRDIRHPHPETAVPLALMLVAFALREMVLLNTLSPDWSPLVPSDDRLVDELTRAFLCYLGADV